MFARLAYDIKVEGGKCYECGPWRWCYRCMDCNRIGYMLNNVCVKCGADPCRRQAVCVRRVWRRLPWWQSWLPWLHEDRVEVKDD